jgi:sigma54-dependent transcription regulator
MYSVWQENFYIVGLDEKYFHDYQFIIDKLVNLRNSVAHGSQREPIDYQEYIELEIKVFELMEELIKYLYRYCFEEKFLSS